MVKGTFTILLFLASFSSAGLTETVEAVRGAPFSAAHRATATAPEFRPIEGMVEVSDPMFSARLIYGTTDRRNHFQVGGHGLYENGAGPAKIYVHADCLAAVTAAGKGLKEQRPDLQFVVYDALRPCQTQNRMFNQVPNPTYVARCEGPEKAGMHNRGLAIDLGLQKKAAPGSSGAELDMGSEFDEFSENSRADAPVGAAAMAHRGLLTRVMTNAGFKAYKGEWWHFNCPTAGPSAQSYPVQP